MTNKELADLMYPNLKNTVEDYEKMYPERNLKEGTMVVRFGPSPTGFVHMGSLLTALIDKKVAIESDGIFYLRIEDTDDKRSVLNGVQGIIDDLKNFNIEIDEGVISETEEKGSYGPYTQSKRLDIYNTYAHYLVSNDYAYPCFCSPESLEETREVQEKHKYRIGYYGKFAKCRELSNDEKAKRIKSGEKYVLRLKSNGDFNKKVILNDLVRGKIEFPENDIDHVLIKSNGVPVYHFAHVVDDHLMHTTHILRGEEWSSSTPLHIELFRLFNFKVPKYAHLGLVMKNDPETGVKRKLSKRKDPEAAVSYYHKEGIPVYAVKLYLLTIANSNFEAWYDANKDKTIDDFKFDFKKMSMSGSLFDIEKLLNISKNYISRLTAEEVYEGVYAWAKEFDNELVELLKDKEYAIKLFSIERYQKKPRKDFSKYSEVKNSIWYMYKDLFNIDAYKDVENKDNINIEILEDYINNYYDSNDDKETWYNKIKELAPKYNYASEVKLYKETPDKYNGHVGDICEIIRVSITSLTMTPDLYEILKLLKEEEIKRRINLFKEFLSK